MTSQAGQNAVPVEQKQIVVVQLTRPLSSTRTGASSNGAARAAPIVRKTVARLNFILKMVWGFLSDKNGLAGGWF